MAYGWVCIWLKLEQGIYFKSAVAGRSPHCSGMLTAFFSLLYINDHPAGWNEMIMEFFLSTFKMKVLMQLSFLFFFPHF